LLTGGAVAIALAGLAIAKNLGRDDHPAKSRETAAGGRIPPPVPAEPEPLMRLHGSNTIGSELAPLLAEGFLRQKGGERISRRASSKPHETLVQGTISDRVTLIEIEALGSTTAFADLASGKCDVGMASRRVKSEEAADLERSGLGDVRSPAGEHVLGL